MEGVDDFGRNDGGPIYFLTQVGQDGVLYIDGRGVFSERNEGSVSLTLNNSPKPPFYCRVDFEEVVGFSGRSLPQDNLHEDIVFLEGIYIRVKGGIDTYGVTNIAPEQAIELLINELLQKPDDDLPSYDTVIKLQNNN